MKTEIEDEIYTMKTEIDNDEEACMEPEEVLENNMHVLQEKSTKKYTMAYNAFMDWCSQNNYVIYTENVLLTYFTELSQKYKSTSLWAQYSMLRSTLNANNSINIQKYSRLRMFLKRKSEGYRAKQAKTFTPEQINRFINEAPDYKYLATKVVLILGIMGACRTIELYSMNIENFEDLNSALLVTVHDTKTRGVRRFTITGRFYDICKKYINLRPASVGTSSFFLNYQKGKCTVQKIGINKFGAMVKQVATFLMLPNPNAYTGNSFRKSSANLFVNEGGDVAALRKFGRWKPPLLARECVNVRKEPCEDDCVQNTVNKSNNTVSQKINEKVNETNNGAGEKVNETKADEDESTKNNFQQKVDANYDILQSTIPSTRTYKLHTLASNENVSFDVDTSPTIHITDCPNLTNITINIVNNKCEKCK